ncbi:MAG: dephospho-CoA kinase [Bacteroidetes bacterium]|nr:dephospho-CoA kinase [Bacteroidota bacterium]MBS1740264.1 dephospho-CoA kinase [Bacteroidota bacterium]MBS1776803.1 dephospho-CoA kinase [Bacteroidota bacterium]
MLKVGITGGIGSGKSWVCQVFEILGIPVFYADRAARFLMENDQAIINSIKALLGDDAYRGGLLDREKIGTIVFKSPELLQKLNGIIHPAVRRYAQQWHDSQRTPYTIKEAAIFFETGSNVEMDFMVGVYAPRKLRILRTILRDGSTQEKVLERMSQQMEEDEKMKRCDYVIINDGKRAILPQILDLHQLLQNRAKGTQ